MATLEEITRRYVREVWKDSPKFIGTTRQNVFVDRWGGGKRATLYSYGHHFPLVEPMTTALGDEMWLVNGDTFSVSTSRHQGWLRNALIGDTRPVLIVPFSALQSAGIDRSSIVPTEVLEDRVVWTPRSSELADAPESVREQLARGIFGDYPRDVSRPMDTYSNAWLSSDGAAHWKTYSHFLGASTFSAEVRVNVDTPCEQGEHDRVRYHPDGSQSYYTRTRTTERRHYLSAFDENEPGRSYFLATLPRKSTSVAHALEILKPRCVVVAERSGIEVKRQGDVFAIPCELSAEALAAYKSGRGLKRSDWNGVKAGRVIDADSHACTEVLTYKGVQYARGTMRHVPAHRWRSAEHVMVKLGKQWHRVVRNTVPMVDGVAAAWQVTGQAD